MNVPSGSSYQINGVDLACSDITNCAETGTNVSFNNVTVSECIVFGSGGKICSGS